MLIFVCKTTKVPKKSKKMDVAFFQHFHSPVIETDKNNLQTLRKVYLPNILQYDFLTHPLYEITFHTVDPCDVLIVSICHRQEKAVVMHKLPLLNLSIDAAAAKDSSSFQKQQDWKVTSFARRCKVSVKSKIVSIGSVSLFWSKQRKTFVVKADGSKVIIGWRSLVLGLGIIGNDAELLLACIPSNASHDLQTHFMLAMYHAELYSSLQNESTLVESFLAEKLWSDDGNLRTDSDLDTQPKKTFLLLSMLSEWYLQFHAENRFRRESLMGKYVHQPNLLIEPIGSQLASAISEVWSKNVLPKIENVLRRSTAFPSEISTSSIIATLIELCWREQCLPELKPFIASFQQEWKSMQEYCTSSPLLSRFPSSAKIRHRVFESLSEGISRSVYSELCKALRSIGCKNMATCATFSLEEQLDDMAMQVWLDGLPWGYYYNPAKQDVYELFRTKFRQTIGLQGCFVSIHFDWLRRRICLWSLPGRQGIWLERIVPNSSYSSLVSNMNQNNNNSTFENYVQQGRIEWIDYATEMMHVELDKTHRHLRPEWFRMTWYDLLFDVSLKWKSPQNTLSYSLSAAMQSVNPNVNNPEISLLSRCKNIVQGVAPLIDSAVFSCVDFHHRSREVVVAVGLYDQIPCLPPGKNGDSFVVLNASSVQRGLFANTLFHIHELQLDPTRMLVNVESLPRKGQRVFTGDLLAEIFVKDQPQSRQLLCDMNVDARDGCFVYSVECSDPSKAVRVVTSKLHFVSFDGHDSFLNRYGNKQRIVARVAPEHLLPFDEETGTRPDMILSPTDLDFPRDSAELQLSAFCLAMGIQLTSKQHATEQLSNASLSITTSNLPCLDRNMICPRTGQRISSSFMVASMLMSRCSNYSTREQDIRHASHESLHESKMVLEIHPQTGNIVSRKPHSATRNMICCNREEEVEEVIYKKWLNLGYHVHVITDLMRPFDWSLSGWSSESQKLFLAEHTQEERDRIIKEVTRRFEPEEITLKRKQEKAEKDGKHLMKDQLDDNQKEKEQGKHEKSKTWYQHQQEDWEERQRRLFDVRSSSFEPRFSPGDYPNIQLDFGRFWRSRQKLDGNSENATSGIVLQLEKETRSFLETIGENRLPKAQQVWRPNIYGTSFQNVNSGRIVPFIDPQTMFILQSKKKFSHLLAQRQTQLQQSDAVASNEYNIMVTAESTPIQDDDFLHPRIEKIQGIFQVGDIVHWLQDVLPQRKWKVCSKETDTVYCIELLPNEPLDGLDQLRRVVIASQLWHYQTASSPIALPQLQSPWPMPKVDTVSTSSSMTPTIPLPPMMAMTPSSL